MTDPVFDQFQRTDNSPAKHAESISAFLNRAKGPEWDAARDRIELWFGRLCPESQSDVRGRVRSRDDRQFDAAVWELYLHETLIRAGFEVSCHPAVPGTSRCPDFLASRDGTPTFYLEATSTTDSDAEVAAQSRLHTVQDSIGNIDTDDFFIWLHVPGQGSRALAVRKFRGDLKDWLQRLDPDDLSEQIARELNNPQRGNPLIEVLPRFDWIDDGWHIQINPIPKRSEARGLPVHSSLGVWGPGIRSVDDASSIRKALEAKGSAYGRLQSPYIIALLTDRMFSTNHDIASALYGSLQMSVRIYPDGHDDSFNTRGTDGYWTGDSPWQHRNVSGVLFAESFNAFHADQVTPTLWLHPDPENPATPLPNWEVADLVGDGIQFVPARVAPSDYFA